MDCSSSDLNVWAFKVVSTLILITAVSLESTPLKEELWSAKLLCVSVNRYSWLLENKNNEVVEKKLCTLVSAIISRVSEKQVFSLLQVLVSS